MSDDEIYEGREQTQVKHHILRHYLERFAHIVGFHWNSITYVDGFAGPWNVRSAELSDSSFSIALDELRKARETHRLKGRDLRLRCCFREQDRQAFHQLEEFAARAKDADVLALNDSFEDSVGAISRYGPPEERRELPIRPAGYHPPPRDRPNSFSLDLCPEGLRESGNEAPTRL